MAAARHFRLVAIADAADRAPIEAAAKQLAACLGQAMGRAFDVELQRVARDVAECPAGSVAVASLADDVPSGEGLAEVERAWRGRLDRLRKAGHERVLLCTLFRRAPPDAEREPTLERIRRLNQVIVTLSRDLGCEIADVDRLLALCGGSILDADYRCRSEPAALVAGQAIAAAILDGELGGDVPPDAQQRAIAVHGGVHNIWRIVTRHAGQGAAA